MRTILIDVDCEGEYCGDCNMNIKEPIEGAHWCAVFDEDLEGGHPRPGMYLRTPKCLLAQEEADYVRKLPEEMWVELMDSIYGKIPNYEYFRGRNSEVTRYTNDRKYSFKVTGELGVINVVSWRNKALDFLLEFCWGSTMDRDVSVAGPWRMVKGKPFLLLKQVIIHERRGDEREENAVMG